MLYNVKYITQNEIKDCTLHYALNNISVGEYIIGININDFDDALSIIHKRLPNTFYSICQDWEFHLLGKMEYGFPDQY